VLVERNCVVSYLLVFVKINSKINCSLCAICLLNQRRFTVEASRVVEREEILKWLIIDNLLLSLLGILLFVIKYLHHVLGSNFQALSILIYMIQATTKSLIVVCSSSTILHKFNRGLF